MINNDLNGEGMNICDLKYLAEMMGGKNHLIKGIMEAFLLQLPDELNRLNDAVKKSDYASIKNLTHTMKSTVSIMGITTLKLLLEEMEGLAKSATDMERIKTLNIELNQTCKRALNEVEREKIKLLIN
jgi:HPt (histidine-containing phosphotransfer) domain-containing protein